MGILNHAEDVAKGVDDAAYENVSTDVPNRVVYYRAQALEHGLHLLPGN